MIAQSGHHQHAPRAVRALFACGLSLLPVASPAFSWDYVPQITIGTSYESNPGFTSSGNEQDGYAANLAAGLSVSGETQRTRISFDPRFATDYFGNSDEENSLTVYLPASLTWSQERITYGLEGGYNYFSSNDFEVTDPNTPPVSGQYSRIRVDDDQEQLYLSPSVNYQITPRDVVAFSLNANDVEFDDASLTGRSNYDIIGARTSWSHSLDLQARITGSAYVSRYDANRPSRLLIEPEIPLFLTFNPSVVCRNPAGDFILCEVDNKSTTIGVDVGYEYALTPSTSIGIVAGVAQSDIEISGWSSIDTDSDPFTPPLPCFDADQQVFISCTLESSDETFIGRLFFDRRAGDTITTGFSIGRSVQPSSDGAVVTNDVANAYLTKQFSTRLSGSLGLSYISQEAVGADDAEQAAARFDVRYWRANAALSWTLTRTWSFAIGYDYSQDEQRAGNDFEVDNSVFRVSATYTGLGRR